jgi:selenocysteine lyase/cysteine desulfurase
VTSSFDRRRFLEATALGFAVLPAASSRALAAAPGPGSGADADPLGVRDTFPITRDQVYLNSAFVGPISRRAREAAIACADDKMLHPTPGHRTEMRDRARARFARLFGAKTDEVALLYSTSDGENIVAGSIDWKEGDNVVVDELHFTTSFLVYRELEKRHGIELRIVPQTGGRARIEDYDARVDRRTRLLSVAWVSNRNGFRHDLRALSSLAHARGALLYTDAIQALGTFPTSLADEGVDFLCTGTYKWLFAGFGVAPFYVREDRLDRIRPDRFGHAQVKEELPDNRFRLYENAMKLEYAALAYDAIYQLDAGLELIEEVGLARIEQHSFPLARAMRDGIEALGFETFTPRGNPSTIVAFVHGRDQTELQKRLERANVMVTFREGGTQIRASVAMFNNQSDVDALLGVLKAIV